ncbi:hypothetical protein [Actinoplanes solisilvae]|nr:hypothetical protein [Actinoplanes solisilvae]
MLTAASVRCLWAGLGAEAHAVQSAADRIGAGSGDQRLLYI